MKRYKEFINESLISKMIGKSEDDVLKSLDKLSNKEKILNIIKYQLSYDLLPRDKNGICIYDGDLNCYSSNLIKLPDNLIVNGNLNCYNNKLTELPENLTVNGFLECTHNKLTKLPENLTVNSDLYCNDNVNKLELPKSAKIKGKFYN
jgi:hypothetical protein